MKTEILKVKSETVILPNPNQLILLRELQKKLCSVPALPLCLKCSELHDITDNISKSDVKGIYIEENRIFLRIETTVNGKECEGRIELGEGVKRFNDSDDKEKERFLNLAQEMASKIKKLSPFKIAQMETEEFENGRIWKITKEKWGKV
ncbi:hypothetical protein [uncultured Treponema sp.]|uniref:hypothetical protein n=1 Tax=uncultured Treponema sp. TaxID=162155 RepID=UPI0025E5D1AB|nr:hypothetical protein [uncultured Treponema sp.]